MICNYGQLASDNIGIIFKMPKMEYLYAWLFLYANEGLKLFLVFYSTLFISDCPVDA